MRYLPLRSSAPTLATAAHPPRQPHRSAQSHARHRRARRQRACARATSEPRDRAGIRRRLAPEHVAASEAGDGAAIGLCASIGAGANAESCTGADGAAASAACAKLGPSRAGACADVCSNKHAWLFVPLSDPVRTVLESSSREWRTVASDVAAPAFGAATAAVSVAPAAGASRPASIAAAPAATFRLCVTALSLSAGREHDSASFPRSRLPDVHTKHTSVQCTCAQSCGVPKNSHESCSSTRTIPDVSQLCRGKARS
eukprot:6174826-Pleurochrysis_carterae.AAC.1